MISAIDPRHPPLTRCVRSDAVALLLALVCTYVLGAGQSCVSVLACTLMMVALAPQHYQAWRNVYVPLARMLVLLHATRALTFNSLLLLAFVQAGILFKLPLRIQSEVCLMEALVLGGSSLAAASPKHQATPVISTAVWTSMCLTVLYAACCALAYHWDKRQAYQHMLQHHQAYRVAWDAWLAEQRSSHRAGLPARQPPSGDCASQAGDSASSNAATASSAQHSTQVHPQESPFKPASARQASARLTSQPSTATSNTQLLAHHSSSTISSHATWQASAVHPSSASSLNSSLPSSNARQLSSTQPTFNTSPTHLPAQPVVRGLKQGSSSSTSSDASRSWSQSCNHGTLQLTGSNTLTSCSGLQGSVDSSTGYERAPTYTLLPTHDVLLSDNRRSLSCVMDRATTCASSLQLSNSRSVTSQGSEGSGGALAPAAAPPPGDSTCHTLGALPATLDKRELGPGEWLSSLATPEATAHRQHEGSQCADTAAHKPVSVPVSQSALSVPPSLAYKGRTCATLVSLKVKEHLGSFEQAASDLCASVVSHFKAHINNSHVPDTLITSGLGKMASWPRGAVLTATAVRGCIQLLTWVHGLWPGSISDMASAGADPAQQAGLLGFPDAALQIVAQLPQAELLQGVQHQLVTSPGAHIHVKAPRESQDECVDAACSSGGWLDHSSTPVQMMAVPACATVRDSSRHVRVRLLLRVTPASLALLDRGRVCRAPADSSLHTSSTANPQPAARRQEDDSDRCQEDDSGREGSWWQLRVVVLLDGAVLLEQPVALPWPGCATSGNMVTATDVPAQQLQHPRQAEQQVHGQDILFKVKLKVPVSKAVVESVAATGTVLQVTLLPALPPHQFEAGSGLSRAKPSSRVNSSPTDQPLPLVLGTLPYLVLPEHVAGELQQLYHVMARDYSNSLDAAPGSTSIDIPTQQQQAATPTPYAAAVQPRGSAPVVPYEHHQQPRTAASSSGTRGSELEPGAASKPAALYGSTPSTASCSLVSFRSASLPVPESSKVWSPKQCNLASTSPTPSNTLHPTSHTGAASSSQCSSMTPSALMPLTLTQQLSSSCSCGNILALQLPSFASAPLNQHVAVGPTHEEQSVLPAAPASPAPCPGPSCNPQNNVRLQLSPSASGARTGHTPGCSGTCTSRVVELQQEGLLWLGDSPLCPNQAPGYCHSSVDSDCLAPRVDKAGHTSPSCSSVAVDPAAASHQQTTSQACDRRITAVALTAVPAPDLCVLIDAWELVWAPFCLDLSFLLQAARAGAAAQAGHSPATSAGELVLLLPGTVPGFQDILYGLVAELEGYLRANGCPAAAAWVHHLGLLACQRQHITSPRFS